MLHLLQQPPEQIVRERSLYAERERESESERVRERGREGGRERERETFVAAPDSWQQKLQTTRSSSAALRISAALVADDGGSRRSHTCAPCSIRCSRVEYVHLYG